MPSHKPKTVPQKNKIKPRGFTLIELLVVISIIGVLAAIVIPSLGVAKNKAYLIRTKAEFKSINSSIELYLNDYPAYPPDVDRGLPSGLEKYLGSNGSWPAAPWPGSVYDWDNWAPGSLTYPPFVQTVQISVRFCPAGQPTQCKFPNEPWAKDFDYHSSAYYCISGSCRAHSSKPTNHPAYCINC